MQLKRHILSVIPDEAADLEPGPRKEKLGLKTGWIISGSPLRQKAITRHYFASLASSRIKSGMTAGAPAS